MHIHLSTIYGSAQHLCIVLSPQMTPLMHFWYYSLDSSFYLTIHIGQSSGPLPPSGLLPLWKAVTGKSAVCEVPDSLSAVGGEAGR